MTWLKFSLSSHIRSSHNGGRDGVEVLLDLLTQRRLHTVARSPQVEVLLSLVLHVYLGWGWWVLHTTGCQEGQHTTSGVGQLHTLQTWGRWVKYSTCTHRVRMKDVLHVYLGWEDEFYTHRLSGRMHTTSGGWSASHTTDLGWDDEFYTQQAVRKDAHNVRGWSASHTTDLRKMSQVLHLHT